MSPQAGTSFIAQLLFNRDRTFIDNQIRNLCDSGPGEIGFTLGASPDQPCGWRKPPRPRSSE